MGGVKATTARGRGGSPVYRDEVAVVIADGATACRCDILLTFADRTTIEDRGVDLCELGSYTAHD